MYPAKKVLAFMLFLVVSAAAIAQTVTEKSQSVTLNILGLQYNYEKPLSDKTTIIWHGGLAGDLGYSKTKVLSFESEEWVYAIRAVAGADFRYYYNLAKRDRLGKNTRSNSANFWSVDLSCYTPPFVSEGVDEKFLAVLTPGWGLRRIYKNNLLFELNLGVYLGVNDSDFGIGPSLNVKFGYSF